MTSFVSRLNGYFPSRVLLFHQNVRFYRVSSLQFHPPLGDGFMSVITYTHMFIFEYTHWLIRIYASANLNIREGLSVYTRRLIHIYV